MVFEHYVLILHIHIPQISLYHSPLSSNVTLEHRYFESNWKEVVQKKSDVVDMLVPFRSAEDVELPLTYSGGVATRYIKKHATFRVETSSKNKRDISLAWLKKCVRKDLSEKEFDSNYLVNRHVLRQNGLCKGTVKKFYEKTQSYVVKFKNGVEERVMLNSLLPMLISEDRSESSDNKNKDEDSAINARFVQALQLLERCGFLRTWLGVRVFVTIECVTVS